MSKAFSAPGKAFLAGGYLVLEPIYDAYVTALSSRMHAVITPKGTSLKESRIKISSPQFANGEWEYHISSNTEKPKRSSVTHKSIFRGNYIHRFSLYSTDRSI